jgi:hypothetical protein
MRIVPIALVLLLLPGCQLVDQRTVGRWFGGRPEGPTQDQLAQANLPPLPLVTIRYEQPDADVTEVLSRAAEDALQARPKAVFEVVTPIPSTAPEGTQNAYIRQGAEDARAVAEALATAGVPPEQIRLSMRGDPGNPPREVLVYVR